MNFINFIKDLLINILASSAIIIIWNVDLNNVSFIRIALGWVISSTLIRYSESKLYKNL